MDFCSLELNNLIRLPEESQYLFYMKIHVKDPL